jgi:uronate dehydrogenase
MTWWREDDRAAIGWEPQDSADGWTAELAAKTSGNPVAERYQGGSYPAMSYSRRTL